ncbi:MAG: NADH-quinone oxidoreductase subunit L [Gammaproteobacteria bacterium]|nr:NADH-quinone oxidoreductase subunit L [Gammaproteobacteria bacterium]
MDLVLNLILCAPLLGCVLSGLWGKQLGDSGSHAVTITLVGVSFVLSACVFKSMIFGGLAPFETIMYHWVTVNYIDLNVGYQIDQLTVFMMVVVTFVSLMVHIYSVGYMKDDPSNPRFFSYISGFTFSMLALVMANNFMLLFFGWEAVGLFSYLLIGFWFQKDSANSAATRAFLVNRVGDVGLLLGMAAILMFFGTLNYHNVFVQVPHFAAHVPLFNFFGTPVSMLTLMCVLLFAGAAGKSAQIPLHIWLEGSMEGPTPISALIHAATMVTAGVFMMARLSPLFEYSPAALSMVMILGAATCFFMGLLGLVQFDIKRVVAFSTLSQLGYMMAAQGASAFSIGLFHLMTHAAFKALLFLAAGSVIVGMHHEQDMRKMGGLARKMPITYLCMLMGALALVALPPFSGFYSKELIIDAVKDSTLPGHSLAYFFVAAGAFVTALYTFRMFFMVFHGASRHGGHHTPHESPWTIIVPLILLAIPSLIAGFVFFMPALHGFFQASITALPQYDVTARLAEEYPSAWAFTVHGLSTLPFWLAVAGVFSAWVAYVRYPALPQMLSQKFSAIYQLFLHKYGIDGLYDLIFRRGILTLSHFLWRIGDMLIIDKLIVDGTGAVVRFVGFIVRGLQTGRLYHYAFAMVLGLIFILGITFVLN